MTLRELARKGHLAQNAKEAEVVPSGPRRIMEPKFDGWRILVEVGGGLYSRSGKTYSNQLPHITEELALRFPPGTWLDAEVVSDEWGAVQSAMTRDHVFVTNTALAVFDIIAFEGIDCRSLPFHERRKFLEEAFSPPLRHAQVVPQYPTDHHARLLEEGYEGSLVKDLDAPYASGRRGYGWTKIKPQQTRDVVVLGFKPGKRGPIGSIIFGAHDQEGRLVELGKCAGHGQDDNVNDSWIGTVIEIAHHDLNGAMRSPQFKRRRPDKAPEQCLTYTPDPGKIPS